MTPEKIKEKISMVNKDIDKLRSGLNSIKTADEGGVIYLNIANLESYLKMLNLTLFKSSIETN